jgi:NAD-dependent histone deacetylase SIR2
LFATSRAWSLHSLSINIGRKHKAHRQRLIESKPRRNSEKGRGKGKGRGKRFNMGNEESRVVDLDTPTQTLRERSVQALAEYIKDGRAKQIVVMVGHSQSVSC